MILAALAFGLAHTFTWKGTDFLLDGKPFVIRSGEMHYLRVPRPYWRDRFRKLRAMGLNTVCTYVFWNAHEPEPGKLDFSGNLDVREYVKEAQQEGLFVLLRPGPYVCSEWEWGGFPYWLANIPGIQIRQNNPQFLRESQRYLDQVGKQLADLTVSRGGPILMCQVENEYGSFGQDHAYVGAIRDQVRHAGLDCQLYTSDGPGQGMLNGGTLPDCLSVCNFGGDPEGAFAEFDKFRQNVPRMCGEYWAGWFDHWGDGHARTDADGRAKDIEWMLSRGISFNIYMAHGGTSWGWMNGANSGGSGYEPDVSSYDYDAAIAEDGSLTPKWHAIRNAITGVTHETFPEPPAPMPHIAITEFRLDRHYPLFEHLPTARRADHPMSFEELNHPYGLVLYRTTVKTNGGLLDVKNLQDRAIVYVAGKQVGTIDRRIKQHSLTISGEPGQRLEMLVENCGRVNFSRALLKERKGFESATLDGHPINEWLSIPVPTDPKDAEGPEGYGPVMYTGTFTLASTGDTFLDLRGWNKGNVWVNGHHIGRFWNIGPQQSQYVPACWLKKGRNAVAVLELDPGHVATLKGSTEAIYEVHR